MFSSNRLAQFSILAACCGPWLSSPANAFDLTGAWATSADQCAKIFVKKGNRVTFTQFSDEFGGGFVADEKQITGKTAKCTIKTKKEVGDTIDLQAVCASDIMVSSTPLRLKILDDNSVTRIFPDAGLEGLQINYYRCVAASIP